MFRDKSRHFPNSLVAFQEGFQIDRTIKRTVQVVDVGDPFRLRKREKFFFQQLGIQNHLARGKAVAEFQRRAILDGLRDRILV